MCVGDHRIFRLMRLFGLIEVYGRGSTASFLDELVYFYRQLPSVSRHVFRGSDASKQRETKLYVSPSIESQSSCYVRTYLSKFIPTQNDESQKTT